MPLKGQCRQNDVCGHSDKKHHCRGRCATCYKSMMWSKEQQKEWKDRSRNNRSEEQIKRERQYVSERNRRRRADPIEKRKLLNWEYKRKYDISADDYDIMSANQNGVCAICEKPETTTRKGKIHNLTIDHNHETGAVRGLLCNNCNRSIGLLKDDVTILQSAINYLRGF